MCDLAGNVVVSGLSTLTVCAVATGGLLVGSHFWPCRRPQHWRHVVAAMSWPPPAAPASIGHRSGRVWLCTRPSQCIGSYAPTRSAARTRPWRTGAVRSEPRASRKPRSAKARYAGIFMGLNGGPSSTRTEEWNEFQMKNMITFSTKHSN